MALLQAQASSALARPNSALLRTQSSSRSTVRLGSSSIAGQRRRQQQHGRRWQQLASVALADVASVATLPAAASEAFMDAAEAAPSSAAAAEPAAAFAFGQPAADQAAAEALAAAQAAAENGPADLAFSILFTIAIGALTLVTLGVAYLSFSSWNDSRMEAADRARFDASTFRASSSNGSTPPKKAKAAASKAPEEFKGFGKK